MRILILTFDVHTLCLSLQALLSLLVVNFLLFRIEKNLLVFPLLVFVVFLGGMYHEDDVTPFHLYLTLGLVYLTITNWKKPKQNYGSFLLSYAITAFLCLWNNWWLIFMVNFMVGVFSFIFIELGPYLNKFLGLEEKQPAEVSVAPLIDRLKTVVYNLYYDPKYLKLMGFWEKTFPKRIAKATNNVLLEVVSLVILSLSTMLHTRFRFLLPAFFFRCFVMGHPMWMLWYFVPVGFLTLLVYYPPYVNFLKKTYGNEVFKDIGWNAGVSQAVTGLRTVFTTTAGVTFLVVADDFVSVNYLNPRAVDKGWQHYYTDLNAWSEARSRQINIENFPNEPTPPDTNKLRQIRIRQTLVEAFNLKKHVGDVFGYSGKFPKKK